MKKTRKIVLSIITIIFVISGFTLALAQDTPLAGPYYLTIPVNVATYTIGSYNDGTYYALRGSDWNVMPTVNDDCGAVINAILADNVKIQFTDGTFEFETPILTKTFDSVTIEGMGAATILTWKTGLATLPTGSSGYPYAIIRNNNVQDGASNSFLTIKDLTINGKCSVYPWITYHVEGIAVYNIGGLTIENVWVTQTNGFGIQVWSSDEVTIDNVHITSTGGAGGGSDGLHIGSGDPRTGGAGSAPYAGIASGYGCRYVNINNYYAYGTGDDSLAVFDSNYVNINNVVIDKADATDGRGIELQDNWNLNLNNFDIKSVNYPGLQLQSEHGGAYNTFISVSNGKIYDSNNGVEIADTYNSTFTNINTLKSVAYGLVEIGTSNYNLFTNIFVGDGSTAPALIIGDNTYFLHGYNGTGAYVSEDNGA